MLNVAVNLGEKIILVGHSNGGLIAFNLSTNPKTQIDSEYDQYQKPAQAGILVSNLILATFGSTEESRAKAYLKMKVPTLIFTTADDDVISHEELLNTQKTAPNTFKVIVFEKGSNVFNWFDSTKARNELNFTPRPSGVAIENSVRWMKDNGLLN